MHHHVTLCTTTVPETLNAGGMKRLLVHAQSMTAHMLNEISNQLVLEENRRKAGVPAASM